jgi:hypothetical protein
MYLGCSKEASFKPFDGGQRTLELGVEAERPSQAPHKTLLLHDCELALDSTRSNARLKTQATAFADQLHPAVALEDDGVVRLQRDCADETAIVPSGGTFHKHRVSNAVAAALLAAEHQLRPRS